MTTYLLDANVVIALSVSEHEFHDAASRWLATVDSFAICPITEGALVRFILRVGEATATARAMLLKLHEHPACSFWDDDVSYLDADLTFVAGHRQVTDAYLVCLAKKHGGVVATFDSALVRNSPDGTHAILHQPVEDVR